MLSNYRIPNIANKLFVSKKIEQHFVGALAASLNEVTRLRNKHLDYGEWGNDEGYYEEGEEYDELDQWYRTDAGHLDAAGIGALDLGERVRRAAAPLRGPLTKTDAFSGPTDFVSAARKAA